MVPVLSNLVTHTVSLHVVLILSIQGSGLAGDADDRRRIAGPLPGHRGRVEQSDVDHVVRRQQHVMGTTLEIIIRAQDRWSALTASEAATRAVAEAERRLSTWREDSELSAINRRESSRPIELSASLARDLGDSLDWSRKTSGFFSPSLGALVSVWNLRGPGRVPSDPELREALAASAIDGTVLVDQTLRFGQPDLRFEEGGFGKGAALRDALHAALDSGAGCVILDFGGQIAVGGDCGPQHIAISDPDDRHREIAELRLFEGSVATSGLSERGFVVDGVRYGHILDPRSGSPAPDWGTVTVVAADPVAADCLATALYVMGPNRGAEWLTGHIEIEAVFVQRNGQTIELTATPGLVGRLENTGGKVTYLPLYQQRMKIQPH